MPPLQTQTRLALLKQLAKRQSWAAKGFTLVELMIVIVIVGVLSAIALPNFLSQTDKAKGTEAKTKLSGLLKEAHAEYQTDGTVATTQTTLDVSINDANEAGIFNYDVVVGSPVTTGTATGNGTDGNITADVVYNGCVNLDNGDVKIGNIAGATVSCN